PSRPRRLVGGTGTDSRLSQARPLVAAGSRPGRSPSHRVRPGRRGRTGRHTAGMEIDFLSGAPIRRGLTVAWSHWTPDPPPRTDPTVQVHAYDDRSYVLRQSKDATYEAPFLFLLFGNDRAILLDTGATKDDAVRHVVDAVVGDWLEHHPRADYQLVVAHSHGH